MTIMKVALFQDIRYERYCTVVIWPEWCDKDDYVMDGYVRISPWREVEFPALPNDEQVQNAIKGIDAALHTLVKAHLEKLRELQTRKANLLSLTHQPVATDIDQPHSMDDAL